MSTNREREALGPCNRQLREQSACEEGGFCWQHLSFIMKLKAMVAVEPLEVAGTKTDNRKKLKTPVYSLLSLISPSALCVA